MDDIDRLDESVEAFCHLIEGLPEPALAEQPWGPKEVLAHLAYHHETYVRQAAARAAGEPFTPTAARWIEVNARAAAESKGVPVAELLRRLREAQRQLAVIYRACAPGNITMILKQGSKRRTLATLVPAVESHFRSHHRQLRRKRRLEIGD